MGAGSMSATLQSQMSKLILSTVKAAILQTCLLGFVTAEPAITNKTLWAGESGARQMHVQKFDLAQSTHTFVHQSLGFLFWHP